MSLNEYVLYKYELIKVFLALNMFFNNVEKLIKSNLKTESN